MLTLKHRTENAVSVRNHFSAHRQRLQHFANAQQSLINVHTLDERHALVARSSDALRSRQIDQMHG